jgi:hypothetical protein
MLDGLVVNVEGAEPGCGGTQSLVQERTAPAMLGRVTSIATLVLLSLQPVSQVAAGMVVGVIGLGPLFLTASGLVFVAAVGGLLSPALRSIE